MKMSGNRLLYLGTFLVSSSMLMFEVLMTRFFSVILFYHYAFLIISIALFGLSFGSLIVYIFKLSQKSSTKKLFILYSITGVYSLSLIVVSTLIFFLQFFGGGDITPQREDALKVMVTVI